MVPQRGYSFLMVPQRGYLFPLFLLVVNVKIGAFEQKLAFSSKICGQVWYVMLTDTK